MQAIIALANKSIMLERNEFLSKKGLIDTNIYFIETGSLRIFVVDQEEEQTIRFGYQGNLIACLDSFLTSKPTDFYIQAIKKTRVKLILKKDLSTFIKTESNHQIWTNLLESLIVQQLEREIDILTKSPRERYQRVLERSPQLFQEIPLKHIANYLRMSPETLSRLKKS